METYRESKNSAAISQGWAEKIISFLNTQFGDMPEFIEDVDHKNTENNAQEVGVIKRRKNIKPFKIIVFPVVFVYIVCDEFIDRYLKNKF